MFTIEKLINAKNTMSSVKKNWFIVLGVIIISSAYLASENNLSVEVEETQSSFFVSESNASNEIRSIPTQHFVFPKTVLEGEENKPKQSVSERMNELKYIFNYAYTACFDSEWNLPVWVSYHLNAELLESVYNKRPSGYPRDNQYQELNSNALRKSGYDHGHLAPAADFKWSEEAYLQSFLMSNMSPQFGCFNQKAWCHLEGTVRKWVEECDSCNAYIASGAVMNSWIDTLCINDETKIFVPESYYKVILIQEKNGNSKSIGFIIPNSDIDNYSLKEYQVTVEEVENKTGLNFFAFLPPNQQVTKTIIPNMPFYDKRVSCNNSDCDKIYSRRTSPENREGLRCE